MLKLDFNERSEGTPAWAERALRNVDAGALWRYPNRAPLEQAIAARFLMQPEQVLATNGGDEGIDLVLRLAKKLDFKLLVPLPAFSMYRITAARNDVALVSVESGPNRTMNLEALSRAVASPGQLLALTSPNNPTGEVVPRAVLREIFILAKAADNVVLLDEAYAEFAGDSCLDLVREFDHVIVLRSFSKAFGLAALRVGWLAAQAPLMEPLKKLALPFNLSTPAILLAQAACEDEPQREMKTYCAQVASTRDALRKDLESLNIHAQPSGGNFLLLQLGVAKSELVANYLKRQGIAIRQFTESELAGCLRITIPANDVLLRSALRHALQPDLICLDMDGVLLDTTASYDVCVQKTVSALGGSEPAVAELQQVRNEGRFNDDWALAQTLLKRLGLQVEYARVVATFQKFYLGHEAVPGLCLQERVLIDDETHKKLLEISTAVVTGRPRAEALEGVRCCALQVAYVVSRDDVKEMKPNPEGIVAAQKNFVASRVWMLGDSVDDMQAALAAGAVAIGVGRHNAEALKNAGAEVVLSDINELRSLL
jgi:histidinol-phosphate aminotransferase